MPLRAIVALVLSFCVSVSVITVYLLKDIYGSISPKLAVKISQIKQIIDADYYFETIEENVMDGISSGYISGIGDKYAAYYSKDNATVVKDKYKGNAHGIGMLCVNTKNLEIYVWRVYNGSSAQSAGLINGDIITYINGKSVSQMGYSKAVKKLQGKTGKTTELTYVRDGISHTANVTFGNYDAQSVFYNVIDDKIGYVQITDFNSKTYLQFKTAIEELKKQKVKKYIFDLRHNSGGTVDSAAKILDYLLPEGEIIHVKNKSGDVTVRNRSDKNYLNAKIVILADNKSASASEIMISAMKDFGAATVMGTKTFGKSLIQRTYVLSDGSMVKLTVGEYVNSKQESYNGYGLNPDIELVPDYNSDYEYYFMNVENDSMLNAAVNQLS